MHFHQTLRNSTAGIINGMYSADILPGDVQIQQTRPEFTGDYTIVVFPLTKISRKGPQETAKELGDAIMKALPELESYEIVKGFLNLLFKEKTWLDYLNSEVMGVSSFWASTEKPRKVMLEYSSPNTNKPLHLGHVRNNLLGFSVAEIMRARGHEVIKANLVNDRGIHICKSMLAWQKYGHGETPESSGLKGDHLVGKYYVEFAQAYKQEIERLVSEGMNKEQAEKQAPSIKEAQQMLKKWEEGDEETLMLWDMLNGWVYQGFDTTYKALGVNFDRMYYESQTYLLGKDIVQEGLEKNVFYKKEDGSVWIDLTTDGLDEKLVLRGDGTSVYITQDLGTAQQRFDEYKLDELIYTVGNEQEYHFKVLQLIFKHFERPWWNKMHHLSYGMVELPEGKMKSREGTVVDADKLIEEMLQSAEEKTREQGKIEGLSLEEQSELFRKIGMSALKFFLLKVDPKKKMLFNPAESIELQGFTGPFIQYSYARIKSILRKNEGGAIITTTEVHTLQPEEKSLIKLLYERNEVLREAEEGLTPAVIANYAYELAKSFNKFYQEHSVLNEADENIRAFRLQLCGRVAQGIAESMKLLGIEMVEQM